MKFQIEAASFQETSKKLAVIAGKKTTIPILTHCLLDLDAGTATATDLNSALTLPLSVAKDGGGRLCLHVQRLADIVAKLEGQLSFEETDGGALLKAAGTKLRLNKLRADDFPKLPQPKGKSLKIPLANFKRMVERVLFSISPEENRYVLNAAQFEIKDKKMKMVATDGHRLAMATEDVDIVERCSMLIPLAALRLIPSFSGEMVEITNDERNLFFACGGELLMQNHIAGQFPNFEAVLPKSCDTKVKVVAGQLRSILERVMLVVDESSKAGKFIFDGTTNLLTIQAESGAVGSIEESLKVTGEGSAITIAFNVLYVLEFLRQVEGDVMMEFKDAGSAGDFLSGENYRYVVMPTRL